MTETLVRPVEVGPVEPDTLRDTSEAKGARLLDKYHPDWVFDVDTDSLTMLEDSTFMNCILTQVYGTYVEGLRVLGLNGNNAWYFGFYGTKAGWIKEIESRLEY